MEFEINSVDVEAIGNEVALQEISNEIELSLFSVTSKHFMLTQFQPFRHDEKVVD